MEFTKTSNVGPLIAAALVGLLALCTDHAFLKPEDVDALLRKLNRGGSEQAAAPRQISPPQLLQDLNSGYQALKQTSRSRRAGKPVNRTGLAKLMEQLSQASSALSADERATELEKSQGQLNYFRSLFLAAEMMPQDYSALFQEFGANELKPLSPAEARKVKLLVAFHRCSQGKMAEDTIGLLSRLKAYSEQETDHDLAIDLYGLLADELRSQGQLIATMKVLEQGRVLYGPHPGIRKLNERLIDLKLDARR